MFGFLGPNGAGKTTTIRMIFGLIFPTSGHVQVLDHRVPGQRVEALRHLGGFVEVPAFYPNMSARRNLRLIGVGRRPGDGGARQRGARHRRPADRGDTKVGGYSHGMKQRLGIANALLNRPELIILDEPTSGLDPQGMKDVRELVRELGKGGTTVFLCSHLLHEVEQVCNRAVIINKGRTVIEGPVSELRPREEAVKVLTSDQRRRRDGARPVRRAGRELGRGLPRGAGRRRGRARARAPAGRRRHRRARRRAGASSRASKTSSSSSRRAQTSTAARGAAPETPPPRAPEPSVAPPAAVPRRPRLGPTIRRSRDGQPLARVREDPRPSGAPTWAGRVCSPSPY